MKYKDCIEDFARKPWKRPTDVVLAFEHPEPVNSVHLAGTLRYRVTKEITREEFLAQLKYNAQFPPCVAATATARASRIDVATAEDQPEPGPEFRYFYRAECV
jgi:hypothetical protein